MLIAWIQSVAATLAEEGVETDVGESGSDKAD